MLIGLEAKNSRKRLVIARYSDETKPIVKDVKTRIAMKPKPLGANVVQINHANKMIADHR